MINFIAIFFKCSCRGPFCTKKNNKISIIPSANIKKYDFAMVGHLCLPHAIFNQRVYITLRLKEFPRAKPKGSPEGGGVYLNVYPELSPYTDNISF